ncbi:MAG TPA: hypothetical protein VGN14_14360 [Candidatus Elarobacter sp.]
MAKALPPLTFARNGRALPPAAIARDLIEVARELLRRGERVPASLWLTIDSALELAVVLAHNRDQSTGVGPRTVRVCRTASSTTISSSACTS